MTEAHCATNETDLFSTIDWGEAWIHSHRERFHHDNPHYWDERALSFCGGRGDSDYITRFIDLMQLEEGETVLDVGCGNGALSIPLAEAGHPVVALDFSPKMLERLARDAQERGLSNIRIVEASWEDDWSTQSLEGIDVAIASRSLGVRDLSSALMKLDSVAQRRACVSIPTTHSPRYSKELWDAIGRTTPPFNDHVYCMNILFQAKILPELQLIESIKHDHYLSYEEACKRAASALGKMTEKEIVLFERFCEDHIIQQVASDGHRYWTRDYIRKTTWAFVSWNTTHK